MRLSPNEIAHCASQAGFAGDDLVMAVAVCLAESSGDTDVMARSSNKLPDGSPNPNAGNRDHGLWQISNRWHPDKLRSDWRNPYVNALIAKRIFDAAVKAGKPGWSPWSVYASKSFEQYLPDARIAVGSPFAPPPA